MERPAAVGAVVARVLPRPVTARVTSVERPPRASVTASAARMTTGEDGERDKGLERQRLPWQERAFAYYELLGEVWYAAQFYSKALQKLELRLVRRVDQDKNEPVTDPDLLDYLDRIQDPGGGRTNLLGAYGQLRFLTGECYLLVTQKDGVERWEMLSCDELRWKADEKRYLRYRLPNNRPESLEEADPGEWEPLDESAIAYRFWKRHPRYSNLADSPMRGVLDLCEELVILTRAVRARGRSRLAGSGILLYPDEMDFSSPDSHTDDRGDSLFEQRLTSAMVTPIKDEGSASAVVPLLVRCPAEYIDKWVHLKVFDPQEAYPETGLRSECIERMAIGLDLPAEVLLGKGGANHWSAWQIDEDAWKAHLQQVAQALVDDLTGGYLRPSMIDAGVANADEYLIEYDASAVINHPDRGRDAKDAHGALTISDDALNQALGFNDEDKPSEEEYLRRVGVLLKNTGLVVDGVPSAAPGSGAAGNGDAGGQSAGPGAVEPGAPEPEAEQPDAVAASADVGLLASELISERARELAGSRMRSRFKSDRRITQLLDGVPNRDVGAVLGQHANGELEALLADRHNLVAGGGDCFRPRLMSWGLTAEDADMVTAAAEQHTAETLFDHDHV